MSVECPGEREGEDFVAENAHTCVFLALNSTKFSLPHLEMWFRTWSSSATSSLLLCSLLCRRVFKISPVYSVVVCIAMNAAEGQYVIDMQKKQNGRQDGPLLLGHTRVYLQEVEPSLRTLMRRSCRNAVTQLHSSGGRPKAGSLGKTNCAKPWRKLW